MALTILDNRDKEELQRQIDERAKLTDVSSPYNFKGNATVATLPISGNEINDTYYCTDAKCRYTWNGLAWFQSSLNEAGYLDELNKHSEEVAEEIRKISEEVDKKANNTDVSSPYNFKGDATVETLPTEGNEINDTYYCTDAKCRYTWNGLAWFQSSLNESEYLDELDELSAEVEEKLNQQSAEVTEKLDQFEYELSAEVTEKLDQFEVEQSEAIADQNKIINDFIAQTALTQYFVDSVEEMTDTTKQYVLKSTGTVWKCEEVTTEQIIDVTDHIVGTDDNPYQVGRISSNGGISTDVTTAVVSPYIDICKDEYVGKTIKIHFEGLQYVTESEVSYVQHSLFGTDKTTVIQARSSTTPNTSVSALPAIAGVNITIISDTSAVVEIPIPAMFNGSQVGYIRFSANGDEANSNIYITYQVTETVTDCAWVDTGILFGYIVGGESNDEETLAKISELNNEGEAPTTVKLLAQPVLEFYNASDYSNDDYTTTHLGNITYPCRADIPIPYTVKWNHNENAMRTTVAVDTKIIGTLNPYTMRTYDATGLDNYPIYNLLPNTEYYYKVTHLLSDGSIVIAKSGSFTTSAEPWRLIYIDGTQNVRDLGGWNGLDGKKVKYGMLFRGAALSDSSFPELIVTGKGRRALGDLGVQAEMNLGVVDTETSIAANCEYTKIGYSNYATAFNDATAKANFKIALEWIVGRLNASKPIYIHCQGGCDRTGTLSFQLLGLLGVSESDLARDYELSSFSDVGYGRLRTTTYEVNTYDYVGMVEAIKAYSGSTISDKFYNFAIDCGISVDTIASFRNSMLT